MIFLSVTKKFGKSPKASFEAYADFSEIIGVNMENIHSADIIP